MVTGAYMGTCVNDITCVGNHVKIIIISNSMVFTVEQLYFNFLCQIPFFSKFKNSFGSHILTKHIHNLILITSMDLIFTITCLNYELNTVNRVVSDRQAVHYVLQ